MRRCPRCRNEIPAGETQCGCALTGPSGQIADPMIGREISGHRILAKVGEGGIGAVYRAEHTLLGEVRAVKVLHESCRGRASYLKRFFREARILSSMRHPNIAFLHDFLQHEDGNLYLVMEWCGGETLRDRIRNRFQGGDPLREWEILQILRQAALGLEEAHRCGIIHRDVSPENIMLVGCGDECTVKIIDFGIARERLSWEAVSHLTGTGVFLGKCFYSSPEQADPDEKDPVDARSDLYSLGVVAYEMITGHLPFEASTPMSYFRKQITEKPKLALRTRDISTALHGLVLRLLEKDRADRPDSALEVSREVDRILGRNEVAPSADRVPVNTRAWTLVAERLPWRREPSQARGAPARTGGGVTLSTETKPGTAGNRGPSLSVAAGLAVLLLSAGLLLHSDLRGAVPGPTPGGRAHPDPAGKRVVERVGADSTLVAGSGRPDVLLTGETSRPQSGFLEPHATAEYDTAGDRLADARSLSALRGPVVSAARVPPTHAEARTTGSTPRLKTAGERRGAPGRGGPSFERPNGPPPEAAAAAAVGIETRRPEAVSGGRVGSPDGTGTLRLNSRPWTRVSLDGRPVGSTPLILEMPAGPHRLLLANEDFGIQGEQIEVEVGAGQTLTRVLEFRGFLRIQSAVPIAVSLNGRNLGVFSEKSWSLLAGPHKLQVTGPDHRKSKTTVVFVEQGSTTEIINPLEQVREVVTFAEQAM